MTRALQHSHRKPLSVPLNVPVKLADRLRIAYGLPADRPRNISIISDAIFGTLHSPPIREQHFQVLIHFAPVIHAVRTSSMTLS
jgi:hypothetical protein